MKNNQQVKITCGCGATLEYEGDYPSSPIEAFWRVHNNCATPTGKVRGLKDMPPVIGRDEVIKFNTYTEGS